MYFLVVASSVQRNKNLEKSSLHKISKVQELNLPEDPCNPDPDYNFFTCVQKNTTEKVPDYSKEKLNYIYTVFETVSHNISTRLGEELGGITGVIQVCILVVLDNSTG